MFCGRCPDYEGRAIAHSDGTHAADHGNPPPHTQAANFVATPLDLHPPGVHISPLPSPRPPLASCGLCLVSLLLFPLFWVFTPPYPALPKVHCTLPAHTLL
ncbi:hypothetical protein BaRGS_00030851 [Batillaria attramentaria]|uniref:Uncharacterized protein n=1 Tax=Batillaria attramentaria TaxID=370345 RepID=A0ABD0JST8_9CAEN